MRTHTDAPAPRVWPFVLAAWTIVALRLGVGDHASLYATYGDSDDALRLVMVRDLLHGQEWWEPTVRRLQPPEGVVMHWSRLVDGAIAALDAASSALAGPVRGELLTRLVWPLLLIGPALWAALRLTARLAGARLARPALWAAAAACAASLPLFAQFHPGRVDHHNVQIVCWLVALAGAAEAGAASAALAGASTALGLAVGLEALALLVGVGAVVAARGALVEGERPRLGAYGAALALAAAAAFALQTPSARWGVSVCDALGLNLAAGLVVAGAGLALAGRARGMPTRALLVVASAVTAAAVYLGLHPACARGPFAEMDPRLVGVWLGGVQEVRPLSATLRADPAAGATIVAALLLGPAAWIAAGADRERRRSAAWALTGAALLLSGASASAMLRMSSYLFWAAVPPVAAAAAMLAERLAAGRPVERVRAMLFGLVLAPSVAGAAEVSAARLARPAPAPSPPAHAVASPDACLATAAYRDLARLPPGRVLAPPDLGPFILAATRHAAISAPYHRMARGVLAAHAALAAPEPEARLRVRDLGVQYVVLCPAGDRAAAAGSLEARLNAGDTPAWLRPASAPGAALAVWRVAPADDEGRGIAPAPSASVPALRQAQ